MIQRQTRILRGVLLPLVAALTCAALAGDETASPPPHADVDELGVEERVRSENWNNLSDFNGATADQRRQWRFRTRAWIQLKVDAKTELLAKLNNENRKITEPEQPHHWDEVIVESLYLKRTFNERWAVQFGRQDILRGEGFVILEGGSGDGSRSMYFNALDVFYNSGPHRLEFLAISNPKRDQYLPRLNSQRRLLTEWDEQALGAYYTRKEADRSLEAYYFYKTETDDDRAPTHVQFQPDRRLHTLGARVVRPLGAGFSATAELAAQAGRQAPSADIRAWGGYAYFKKSFEPASKPSLSLGYFAMSGDDPSTPEMEGWDPLFSRWPKWSELYIYTLAGEEGVAYWTNLRMWQAEFLVAPAKSLNLRATYYLLDSEHPFPGSAAVFGGGTNRGDLFQVRADFNLQPHWRGHLLYESFDPGDFYSGQNRAWFLRAELTYTLKKQS